MKHFRTAKFFRLKMPSSSFSLGPKIALMMEALRTSETPFYFYKTTLLHTP
jgi:hypothetical protein